MIKTIKLANVRGKKNFEQSHFMAEKLNKIAIYRAAKPKEKDYTNNDGGGLK